jgi:hypothetical protein
MSGWGARETNERRVAGVQVSEVGDLVGEKGASRAAGLGPAGHAGLEEEPVDDQLAAAVEQVDQARRSVRAHERVVLLDGHHRHPPTLGGDRVAGASQLLLLHQQFVASGLPLVRGHDRMGLHWRMPSLRYSSTTPGCSRIILYHAGLGL